MVLRATSWESNKARDDAGWVSTLMSRWTWMISGLSGSHFFRNRPNLGFYSVLWLFLWIWNLGFRGTIRHPSQSGLHRWCDSRTENFSWNELRNKGDSQSISGPHGQIRHFLPYILGTRLGLDCNWKDCHVQDLPKIDRGRGNAGNLQNLEPVRLSPLPTVGLAGFSPKTHRNPLIQRFQHVSTPQKLQEISTNDACRLGSYSLFLEPQKVALILSQPIPLYCLVNTSPYCQ